MDNSDSKEGFFRIVSSARTVGRKAVGEARDPKEELREIHKEIDELVNLNRVVLFMKGSPNNPMCGFSARAVSILKEIDHPFIAIDVLQDERIREGIKEYADWPTIPQLFVDGQFIGGSDIMSSLHESGELKGLIVR